MGEELNTCYGITEKGRRCGQPLKEASYCGDHRWQECQDVEMFDVDENSCWQSKDVKMGGM